MPTIARRNLKTAIRALKIVVNAEAIVLTIASSQSGV